MRISKKLVKLPVIPPDDPENGMFYDVYYERREGAIARLKKLIGFNTLCVLENSSRLIKPPIAVGSRTYGSSAQNDCEKKARVFVNWCQLLYEMVMGVISVQLSISMLFYWGIRDTISAVFFLNLGEEQDRRDR